MKYLKGGKFTVYTGAWDTQDHNMHSNFRGQKQAGHCRL